MPNKGKSLLETKSELPLYLQIKQDLVARIESEEFKEGEKIPTEDELQEMYSVSRATIRHALQEIETEGLIRRTRGIGTIVQHKRITPQLMKLVGFSELMNSKGMKPHTETIQVDIVDIPQKARKLFGYSAIKRTWFIKRLYMADNKPVGISNLYLPHNLEFAPQELLEMKSFYKLIADKYDLIPAIAKETLTATAAKKNEAELLGIKVGEPLLDIWRSTSSSKNRIIEVVHILYIASRFEYEFNLYR